MPSFLLPSHDSSFQPIRIMSSLPHPESVLFQGEKPFPILPAVDHYAGSEKLMLKEIGRAHV